MAVNVDGSLVFPAYIEDRGFDSGIEKIKRQLQGLTDAANKEAAAIENVASKASVALGSYLSLNALTSFVRETVQVRGEFEQLSVAFNTMLQSKEKADKLLAESVKLAATTPFSLRDVATGAKQLLAYGSAAEKIPETLKRLGDVAAGTSQPLGDLVYLYGTLQTQGRAYTRDIIQFTGRGIPIIDALAKQFGVAKEQVQGLVEAGKVGFPEIEKAFNGMTSQGGLFFNLMESQSKTVTGQISNLGDAFDRMLNDIGQSNEGIIKGAIGGLTNLVTNYQDVIDVIKLLITIYGAYKAAVIAQVAYTKLLQQAELQAALSGKQLTTVQSLLAAGSINVQRAFKALSTTLLANPFAIAVAGIAALIYEISTLTDVVKEVKTATEILQDSQEEANATFQEQANKIQQYVKVLQNQNIAEDVRLDAYNKLKELAPSIIGALSEQEAKTADLTTRTNEYITSLRQRIQLESLQAGYAEALKQKEKAFAEAEKQRIADAKKSPAVSPAYVGGLGYVPTQANSTPAAVVAARKAAQTVVDFEVKIQKTLGATTQEGIQARIDSLKNENTYLDNRSEAYKKNFDEITRLQAQIRKQNTETPKPARTVAVIDEDIKAAKEQQQTAATRAEYDKFTETLKKLQQERDAITGGNTEKALKTEETLENRINAVLEARQTILDKIISLQRDSKQSGLLNDDSEVDKVREKYDQTFQAIEEYNKKIDDFNKKNKTNLKGIGLADIDALKQTEAVEIANTQYKQDADNYISSLDDKKKAFDDLKRIQDQGNQDVTDQAIQTYKEQLGGFTSYIDYLKDQAKGIQIRIAVEGPNVRDLTELQAVNKAIITEQNKNDADRLASQQKFFNDAYTASQTYTGKLQQIDKTYFQQRALISAFYSGKERADRLKNLELNRTDAINAAKDEAFQKTAVYAKLNEDIVQLTRQQAKDQIAATKAALQNTDITPELRSKFQNDLENLNKVLSEGSNKSYVAELEERKKLLEKTLSTEKLSVEQILAYKKNLQEINALLLQSKVQYLRDAAGYANSIGSGLNEFSDAIKDTNAGLSDTAKILGDASTKMGELLQNAAGAATGDPTSIIKLVTGQLIAATKAFNDIQEGDTGEGILRFYGPIGGAIADAIDAGKASAKAANDELESYQNRLTQGAIDYNQLLRERERTQLAINDATVTELENRQKLLGVQTEQAQKDYETLLKQIQQQGEQITGEHTEKYGGIFGIGRKTRVVQDTADVSDATYADLEKLYTEGKLTDETKAWFEELQKVHDEMDTINDAANETSDALKQALTGTTSDSIADNIIKGLADGKRASADFADDFEALMKNAVLQSLKYNALQKPIQDFYDQFYAATQSGNELSESEITDLQNTYNGIIDNAAKQFEDLKNLTGLDFNDDTGATPNSLQGAVKNITEQSAELLAGQIGAQRQIMAEMQILSQRQLEQLVQITNFVSYLPSVDSRLRDIQFNGVKIKG